MGYNRKKLLIYPEIQLPLLYASIGLAFVVTAIHLVTLFYFVFRYRYGDIDFRFDMILDVVFNIFVLRAKLLFILLISFGAVLFVFIRYYLYLSNKFAGPLYQIEKTLDKINNEGVYQEISIRKKDFLHRFIVKLNQSLSKIKPNN